MATTAFYHSLPAVTTAHDSLAKLEFDKIKSDVGRLLLPFGDAFGMCLVHRHFNLFEGEVMADGDDGVCKPRKLSSGEKLYPKRFDREGNPFEFSTIAQAEIPQALFDAFRSLVPEGSWLGLYTRQGDEDTEEADVIEVTDDDDDERAHRLVPIGPEHDRSLALNTTWFVDKEFAAKHQEVPLKGGQLCYPYNHRKADESVPLKGGQLCYPYNHRKADESVPLKGGQLCYPYNHRKADESVQLKGGQLCYPYNHRKADENVPLKGGQLCYPYNHRRAE